jgi:hypothetical protein
LTAKPEEKTPEKPLRKEWRVRDIGGLWIILRARDVYEDEAVWRAPLCISEMLGRWILETAARPVLLDLLRELWGGIEPRLDHPRHWKNLFARLVEEFRRGRLVLIAPQLDASVPPAKARGGGGQQSSLEDVLAAAKERQSAIKARDEALRAQKLAAKQKTWVGIRLRDEDGNPVPDERYRVVLPDGSVQEGTLNSKGEASFYEIDPGDCQITFPDLDGKEWKPA